MEINKHVTDLLKSHRSIRKYKNIGIPDDILKDILDTAQWAPSHHNVQAYSIIVIKDKQKKEELSSICAGQKYVRDCPVFLVFCMDFYRIHLACEMYGEKLEVDEVENIIIGSVDTALVAENVLIAASAHQLGGVMIGGIRNDPNKVSQLLNLPPYTMPIMGMCLGYPDDIPWQKPRLPRQLAIHSEEYDYDSLKDGLVTYEDYSAQYYIKRTKGVKTTGWTKQISNYISQPRRKDLVEYLRKQGFDVK
ncbi:oxygen-insensitive NADPH nitroreductase [Virgibacillus byunsanensis]|uniref:Oxygen-insensitive NADPH nitroreductase n=1 Tax=Virgibacillus byunsanensis TaxID=570945 RepID=A0ABW3LPS1_9BACI